MSTACTIFGRGSDAESFHDMASHSDVTSANGSGTLCFHKHISPNDSQPGGQADTEKEQK